MELIILGGGFAGLRLARKMGNVKNVSVTLIDRYNYHQFQPLFYQVATSGLNASDISFPLRKVFHDYDNIKYVMADVERLSVENKEVVTNVGVFQYDKLVIATGATSNFFGNKKIEQFAYPMKSINEALELKNRILENFEEAALTDDIQLQERLLNIVIVGAGPTGVELAGALADMKRFVLPKDYPTINFNRMKIYLLEGSSFVLNAMSRKSKDDSRKFLEKLGVEVWTDTFVDDYDGQTMRTKDGRTIATSLLIWAAGIAGNVPNGVDKAIVGRGNRIKTNAYAQLLGIDDVYAIGDVALMDGDAAYPNGHPQVAPVAMQMADLVANNLRQSLQPNKNLALKPFAYKDKGSMATVGRNLAVVDIPKPRLHMKGLPAWFVWMALHLMMILGVKNRLFVFAHWVYNYFTRDQNLRLIFKISERMVQEPIEKPST